MIEKVNFIAKNPMAACSDEMIGMHHVTKKNDKAQVESEKVETDVLEEAILKIGQLLALGFGEAGSKIIAVNMKSPGELDPMNVGQKIIGIFGFCDI